MARYNLEDYENVEERIKRFYSIHEEGRITTDCVVAGQDGRWLFKAYVYLTSGDQANNLPKATGYASEVEGGPQTDWKAELGETSAIGRALANMNLSGNKRASREEMKKVASAEATIQETLNADRDWLKDAQALTDTDALRKLYMEAKWHKADAHVLKEIEKLAKAK